MGYLSVRTKGRYGFSLTELLIGITVTAVLSAGLFSSFIVIARSQSRSRNEATANILAQSYIEDIRNTADSDYDGLETLYKNTELTDVPDYAGFRYNQNVEKLGFDLKKAQVKVAWDKNGSTGQRLLVTLLTRPPELLPGNIDGFVYDANTNAGIKGVKVEAIKSLAKLGTATDPNGYYTYELPGGQFQLPTGKWLLQATATGYKSSQETGTSVEASVPSGLTVRAEPIYLTPLPAPGIIRGTVQEGSISLEQIAVYLYQNGARAKDRDGNTVSAVNSSSGSGALSKGEYNFTNLLPGKYTVATYQTYTKGYTYFFGDSSKSKKPYSPDGWSSAWSTWPSSDPRQGSSGSDSVSVTSGVTTTNDIPLDPIPTGNVTGIVYEKIGSVLTPLKDANVRIRWWGSSALQKNVTTDATGRYTTSFFVPYFVFNDVEYYWNSMQASKSGYYAAYPDKSLSSVGVKIGSAYKDRVRIVDGTTTGDVNFLLITVPPPAPQKVGNVEGYVKDNDTSGALAGATVTIGGKSSVTDSSGYYLITNIPIGSYTVSGKKSKYYSFSSGSTKVPVQENTTSRFDFKMQAIGYGTVKGTIRRLDTGNPISGASVSIAYFAGAPESSPSGTTTDSSGQYIFNGIVETPSGKAHAVKASAAGFLSKEQTGVSVTKNATTIVDLKLALDAGGL